MDDLLKILDMSEHQQHVWLYEYFKGEYYQTTDWSYWYGVCDILIYSELCEIRRLLADLAFRLRDEVGEGKMFDDLNIENEVYKYVIMSKGNKSISDLFLSWWICHSKPIHWIIAAFIAKKEAKS